MYTEQPFQGIRTFCKTPVSNGSEKVSIIGLPIDCATSFRSGTRMAPSSIRDSSMMLVDGVEISTKVNLVESGIVGDCGDLPLNNVDFNGSRNYIEQYYDNIKSIPISLGGDHSITYPILKSLSKKYNKIVLIHFDAHHDCWSDHFGSKSGHGTWLRELIEEKCIDPKLVLQIGIRSSSDIESNNYLRINGGTVIGMNNIATDITFGVVERFIRMVKDINDENIGIYISFDIDCLDPAFAPGTGTPEIGGLTSREVLEFINVIFAKLYCMGKRNIPIIGMDMVEVCPSYDISNITSLAAATICWKIICYMIYHKVF